MPCRCGARMPADPASACLPNPLAPVNRPHVVPLEVRKNVDHAEPPPSGLEGMTSGPRGVPMRAQSPTPAPALNQKGANKMAEGACSSLVVPLPRSRQQLRPTALPKIAALNEPQVATVARELQSQAGSCV